VARCVRATKYPECKRFLFIIRGDYVFATRLASYNSVLSPFRTPKRSLNSIRASVHLTILVPRYRAGRRYPEIARCRLRICMYRAARPCVMKGKHGSLDIIMNSVSAHRELPADRLASASHDSNKNPIKPADSTAASATIVRSDSPSRSSRAIDLSVGELS